jgi:hypothetical protein
LDEIAKEAHILDEDGSVKDEVVASEVEDIEDITEEKQEENKPETQA